MERFLLQLWDMSIQAGFVICVALVVRMLFIAGKAPRRFCNLLWAFPFLRMLLPWQPESSFSVMPQTGSFGMEPGNGALHLPGVAAGMAQAARTAGKDSHDFLQLGLVLAGVVWLTGMLLFLTYSIASYLRLKRRLVCSVRMEANIYLADGIDTPFVMGFFRPRIYLPSDVQAGELDYVIAHEQTHIRRGDHIIKAAAFFAVCVHWFNPLAWIAFVYMGKDMEMSCDEAVVRRFGEDCRKEYASALLAFTGREKHLASIPLAFAEGNTGKRITNIMKYKKPLLLAGILAAAALVALAAGLLTRPEPKQQLSMETETETAPKDTKRDTEKQKPSADTETGEKDTGTYTNETMDELKSSLYAMEVEENMLTAEGAQVRLYNYSDSEVLCGEDYKIQRLEKNKWTDIAEHEIAYHDIAYTVTKEGFSQNIDWSRRYGKLSAGTYLLTKKLSVQNEKDGYDTITCGVMFELTQGDSEQE